VSPSLVLSVQLPPEAMERHQPDLVPVRPGHPQVEQEDAGLAPRPVRRSGSRSAPRAGPAGAAASRRAPRRTARARAPQAGQPGRLEQGAGALRADLGVRQGSTRRRERHAEAARARRAGVARVRSPDRSSSSTPARACEPASTAAPVSRARDPRRDSGHQPGGSQRARQRLGPLGAQPVQGKPAQGLPGRPRRAPPIPSRPGPAAARMDRVRSPAATRPGQGLGRPAAELAQVERQAPPAGPGRRRPASARKASSRGRRRRQAPEGCGARRRGWPSGRRR